MGQIEEGNFQKNVILHSIGTPLLWRQVLLVISYQGFFVGTVNYFYCLAIDYSEIPTESIGSIDKTNLLVGAQEREKRREEEYLERIFFIIPRRGTLCHPTSVHLASVTLTLTTLSLYGFQLLIIVKPEAHNYN